MGSFSGATRAISYSWDFDVASPSGGIVRWIPSGTTGPAITKAINESNTDLGVTCFATGYTGYILVQGSGVNWYGLGVRPRVGG